MICVYCYAKTGSRVVMSTVETCYHCPKCFRELYVSGSAFQFKKTLPASIRISFRPPSGDPPPDGIAKSCDDREGQVYQAAQRVEYAILQGRDHDWEEWRDIERIEGSEGTFIVGI